MGIKKILIKIGAAVIATLTAIFYVFYQSKKIESLEEKLDTAEKNENAAEKKANAAAVAEKAEIEVKLHNEDLLEKAHYGNRLDSFYAGTEFLSK